MKINITKVYPCIYHVNFETQYDLCMSFMRIQEFYENPKFRGKYFTVEQFMDYWVKECSVSSSLFDYTNIWNGFNVPGKILRRWDRKFASKEGLTARRERERILCNAIYKVTKKDKVDWDDIYIIGTWGKNKTVIAHELAHAFYALDKDYKKDCDRLLKKIDKNKIEKVKKSLLASEYNERVLNDEMQAYFSSSSSVSSIMRPEFKANLERYENKWKNKTLFGII